MLTSRPFVLSSFGSLSLLGAEEQGEKGRRVLSTVVRDCTTRVLLVSTVNALDDGDGWRPSGSRRSRRQNYAEQGAGCE